MTSSMRAAPRARGAVAPGGVEQRQVPAARQVGVEGRALDERAHAAAAPAAVAGHRLAEHLDRPAVGKTSPSSMRMVVVLPAPLGPRKP